MAQLAIKVDDNIKEAFNELASELGLTQSQMIEKAIQALTSEGQLAKQIEALKVELVDKEKEYKTLHEMSQSLSNENKALTEKVSELEKQLVESSSKASDLKQDVKELAEVTRLRKSIHVYAKHRARVMLKPGSNITEDQAVELFTSEYSE